jgi:hypothetical protein
MSKKSFLAILVILALVLLWIGVEKGRLDATRGQERQDKDAAERHRAEHQIAEMAKRWNATGWNQSTGKSTAMNREGLESASQSHRAVVLLGTLDSVVSATGGQQYFITLTDVQDRLLVKLTCDAAHIVPYRDAARIDQLYSQFAAIVKVESVNKLEGTSGPGSSLYDFEVTGGCVDAIPLHFTDYTRLSDLKIPAI